MPHQRRYEFRRSQEVAVEEADPFANDKLARRIFVENLATLIGTLTQPATFALNGSWGTGKTTVLRMLVPTLKRDGHETVFFNAWENDHVDDPLIGLLAEVQRQSSSTKASRKWERAKRLGSAVARTTIPIAAKLLTANILDLEAVKASVHDPEGGKVIADFVKDASEHQIDAHVKAQRTVAAFRSALEAFARTIPQHVDGRTRSLVIIVDELDRCRPTFAVETLERIKHLFNVPNVAFLLALDLVQLQHSVSSLYGEGMDAQNYLRRFIDLTCNLPRVSSAEFCKSLYTQFQLSEVLSSEGDFVAQLFSATADAFVLPLRTQEQLFAEVAVAARLLHGRCFGSVEITVILIILRTVEPALYRDYMDGHRRGLDVLTFLRSHLAVAAAIEKLPIVDALLYAYSRVAGERQQAMQAITSDASSPSAFLGDRSREIEVTGWLREAAISGNSLQAIIQPALEFTTGVLR